MFFFGKEEAFFFRVKACFFIFNFFRKKKVFQKAEQCFFFNSKILNKMIFVCFCFMAIE